jgi:hypothetical protein
MESFVEKTMPCESRHRVSDFNVLISISTQYRYFERPACPHHTNLELEKGSLSPRYSASITEWYKRD